MKPSSQSSVLPCALAAAFLFVACGGDTSGPQEPPVFAGSWTASSAIVSGGGDVTEDGFEVGMLFIPTFNPAFVFVSIPPADSFAEAQVVLGFLRAGGVGAAPDDIFFFDLEQEILATGKFDFSNQTLTFDLQEGLGFSRLVLVGSPGPHLEDLHGSYEATQLMLEDSEGGTLDLLEEGGSAQFSVAAEIQNYQLNVQAPAGTLDLDPVLIDNSGVVEVVGRSVLLVDGLGCDFFAGFSVLQGDELSVRGLACDLGGSPYLLDAVFERS